MHADGSVSWQEPAATDPLHTDELLSSSVTKTVPVGVPAPGSTGATE